MEKKISVVFVLIGALALTSSFYGFSTLNEVEMGDNYGGLLFFYQWLALASSALIIGGMNVLKIISDKIVVVTLSSIFFGFVFSFIYLFHNL